PDRGKNAGADLTEADAGPVRAGRGGRDGDLVAVLDEGAGLVTDLHGFRSTPGELDEGAALVLLRARDGAGAEQITGAGRGTVDGGVGEHLRGRPVHLRVRR